MCRFTAEAAVEGGDVIRGNLDGEIHEIVSGGVDAHGILARVKRSFCLNSFF